MNGNELNNMAQRYKDEMMRLYQKSSASRNLNTQMNNNQHQSSQQYQNQTASRDIAGTPVPGVPGASFYGSQGTGSQQNNASDSVTMPVTCECRFPSAESIINSIANTPMTLPITPDDNPPPVYDNPSTSIQPRNDENNDMSNMQSRMKNTSEPAVNVTARSIMLNSSPEEATYILPTQNENEQEILPDFALPADIPAEATETAPTTARFSPSLSWISLTGDNSWGFLQFDVYTSDGARPIPGALVTVKKTLPGGSGLVRLLFTNRSGRTPTIALPAPSASLSQTPGSTARPFSEYSVTVRARGFYTLKDINLPIFAGVKTVQPIDLIPLPEYTTPIQPRNASDNGISDSPSVG
ncbi:MAG: hypothetical protein IJ368_01775 [Oscillospiraceae bacterium]|nr:hypothetical protein [Oscillospiraceae bacterium]